MQVERDALEEMVEVVDAKAAPLEDFELVVEAFHKAATLPLAKVVGDQIQPGVQELQEAIQAAQLTRLDLPTPGPDLTKARSF